MSQKNIMKFWDLLEPQFPDVLYALNVVSK